MYGSWLLLPRLSPVIYAGCSRKCYTVAMSCTYLAHHELESVKLVLFLLLSLLLLGPNGSDQCIGAGCCRLQKCYLIGRAIAGGA